MKPTIFSHTMYPMSPISPMSTISPISPISPITSRPVDVTTIIRNTTTNTPVCANNENNFIILRHVNSYKTNEYYRHTMKLPIVKVWTGR